MRPTGPVSAIARQSRPHVAIRPPFALVVAIVLLWIAIFGMVALADGAAKPAAEGTSAAPRQSGWMHQWLADDDAKPFEIATAIITLGGFLVTIWSIRKLTEQTTLVGDALRQSAIDSITTQAAEANKIFIENPELRQYFYDGEPIKKYDPNYAKVLSIAEYMLDYFDSVLTQLHYFPKIWASHATEINTWERYIKDTFENSPVLRQMLGDNEDWYGRPGEEWRNMVDLYHEVLTELAVNKAAPAPPSQSG